MSECLRFKHAINQKIRGSTVFFIFDLHSQLSCYAVLELVTTNEKPIFDRELEIVCGVENWTFTLFGYLTTSNVECDGSWLGDLHYKVDKFPCTQFIVFLELYMQVCCLGLSKVEWI